MRWSSASSSWKSRAADVAPFLSVVIPTYRRIGLLQRCVRALTAQSLPAHAYEILVIDDGREAAVEQFIAQTAESTGAQLRYLRPPPGKRGPAAARNAGWRNARGDIVAFTDDDTIAAPDWLERGLHAMQGDVVAVSGQVRVPVPDCPTDYERNVKQLERAEFVTANCFVRHDALESVCGFDERFVRAWREDSDLHFKLLERFGCVGRARDALVVHPARPARWGVSLREQANVLYDALLYKKHPRLYRARIRAVPPLGYYAATVALAAGPIAWLLGYPLAAVTAAAAWLAITLRLFARRVRGTSRAPSHLLEMAATSALIPPLSVGWRLAGALRFRAPFV